MTDDVNWWDILSSVEIYSSSWHTLLLKIWPYLSRMRDKSVIPPNDTQLFETLGKILSNYAYHGWVAHIDGIEGASVSGWVKKADSDASQFVTLCVNGEIYYECFLANAPRLDVKKAGYGSGLYGFNTALDPQRIEGGGAFVVTLHECRQMKILAFRFFCASF